MSDVTALFPAPAGYVVDFENPQRRGDIATYWCFGVGVPLAMAFTAQRVYVKLGLGIGWAADDWLLAVSWVTSMVSQICVVYGFANKFIGVHAWEISIDQFNRFLLDLWVSAPIYVLAGSCTKMALLVFYLKISPQKWMRYGVFATMAFITGYSFGIFFSLLFACNPVQKSFDVSITEGNCLNSTALYIATAVCNIVSDVILFILPIPMVLSLQLRRKQKLGLLFIFGIGSITVVTSIVRACILPEMLTSTDTPWAVAYASMLIVIEANLMIICGMLPTLRKFFQSVAPKIIGESTYGKGTGRSGHDWSKTGHGRSPALITFGSLPSKGGMGHHRHSHNHGGGSYANFGGGDLDTDGYALDRVGAGNNNNNGRRPSMEHNRPPHLKKIDAYDEVGCKGRVDTHVMADHPRPGDWDDVEVEEVSPGGGGGGGGLRRSLSRSRSTNRSLGSAGSEESQLPIVGLAVTKSKGIKATTRIEVSYVPRDPAGSI